MARFERSKGRKRDSRGGSSRRSFGGRRDSRGSSSRRSFGGRRDSRGSSSGRRDSGRRRDRRDRGNMQKTKVTCASCGNECEIPFKPTTDKPVYCDDCFAKEGKSKRGSGNRNSGKDLKIINEKLDKIMKALKIE